jgi:8-oxo-dGTP pyrophosphatase MutT (NUDIX family)
MTKEHYSAGGVLADENGKVYLIHKTSRDEWLLPKGTVEKGEKTLETAIREVREETGYNKIRAVSNKPILTTSFSFVEPETRITVNKYVTYYLFRLEEDPSKGETTEQMVHEELKGAWFTYEEALEKLSFKELKEVLVATESLLSSS